jgi:hypothetical protein
MRAPAMTVFVALSVALAGCGGGKSKGAAPSTTAAPVTTRASTAASKAAVAKAVKAYSAALVAGQGKKAYPMLSAHCRTVITAPAFNALAAQAHATYPKAKITKLTVNDVTGTHAHVTYRYADAVLDQTRQSWVKEHGSWRWNAC